MERGHRPCRRLRVRRRRRGLLVYGLVGPAYGLRNGFGDLPRRSRSLSGDRKDGAKDLDVFVRVGCGEGRSRAVERSTRADADHATTNRTGAANGASDFNSRDGRGVRVVFDTIRKKFTRHIAVIRIVHLGTRDLPGGYSVAGTSLLVLCVFRLLCGSAEFMAGTSVVI